LKKTAQNDVSRYGREIELHRAAIPIFYLRPLGGFVDISRTLKSIDTQGSTHRAKVGVANAVPRIPKAAQLRFTLEAVADNNLHPRQE
jgi:hypothetical protein